MSTVVIGAGAVGLSCAFELADRGEGVVVVDAGAVGAAASAGNAGWVTPFLSTPRAAPGAFTDAMRSFFSAEGPARIHPKIEPGFVAWSLGFLRAGTQERNNRATAALQALTSRVHDDFDALLSRGVEFEDHRDGLAVVFQQPEGLEVYRRLEGRMRGLGYRGEITVYEGGAVREFDPAISRDAAGVMHLESERHVRPETLTAGLAQAVRKRGGDVIDHDAVDRIVQQAKGWRVELSSGRALQSDSLVVAAGFHVRRLLKPLGVRVPVEAAKGLSATIRGDGTAPAHPLKLYEHMVACSPFEGSVRFSGTFDVGVRDARVHRKRLDMIVRQGLGYLEDWQPTQVDIEWAGHRPTSADDIPIVGAVPGKPGLHLATGHGTLGVTLGPTTGRLLAGEILDGRAEGMLTPFRLSRFGRFA